MGFLLPHCLFYVLYLPSGAWNGSWSIIESILRTPVKAIFEKVRQPPDASFLCWEVIEDRFPFVWHYHPEYELTLITRGRGTRFVGDSIADFSDGDLVLIGPDMPHTWCAYKAHRGPRGPHKAVCIQFTENFLGDRFFQIPEMQRVSALLERCGRGLTFSRRVRVEVNPLIAAMHKAPSQERLTTFLKVLIVLSRADAHPMASENFRPLLASNAEKRMDVVCRYLNEHLSSSIKHADLARLVRMNPASFSRFFKSTIGKTLTDYVNELRVGLACRLLIESDLSILEVCHRSGFNNFSNFSRRFKAIKTVNPKRFRTNFQDPR